MIDIAKGDVELVRHWIKMGLGLAIWHSRNPNNPAVHFSPAYEEDGNPSGPPYPWCKSNPSMTIQHEDQVFVKDGEIVDRFLVWAKKVKGTYELKPNFKGMIDHKMKALGPDHWFQIQFDCPTRGLCKIFHLTFYERLDRYADGKTEVSPADPVVPGSIGIIPVGIPDGTRAVTVRDPLRSVHSESVRQPPEHPQGEI